LTATLIVFAVSLLLTNLLWAALLIWAISRKDNVSLAQTFKRETAPSSEPDLTDLFNMDPAEILDRAIPKPSTTHHVYEIEPDETPIQ